MGKPFANSLPSSIKLINFQYQRFPMHDYHPFGLSSSPQDVFMAPSMDPSAHSPRYTLPADLLGSALRQTPEMSYLSQLNFAATGDRPLAISIPMKANPPKRFRKLRLEDLSDNVHNEQEKYRRVPMSTYAIASASELSHDQSPPSGRTGRQESNPWRVVGHVPKNVQIRPKGVVVSQHNVQLSPTREQMQRPVQAQPQSRPTSYSRIIAGRFSNAGLHQIEPPKLEGTRPANVPPPTEEVPYQPVQHPAFVTENPHTNNNGFRPLTSTLNVGRPSTPAEPLDYGTDIITIHDVDRNNKKTTVASGNYFKAVTSSLQVKSTGKAITGKGKVFDDVIYDYPGDDHSGSAQSRRGHARLSGSRDTATTPMF
ncbi:hypothetical protein HDE_14212 [Halotydeus destructor]|nr:hypothetical protein HDE_14212 [Halotydeus destructor]